LTIKIETSYPYAIARLAGEKQRQTALKIQILHRKKNNKNHFVKP
jgi:hypothetical protein